ncbi:DNA polymerase III subunit chi [Teichococcus cervicalis]|uniref:Putative DNA polymerase III subunit chi n=1 Tax=Pseudoroseomonas cervicalis ATCC 49957 TaxID=525371 RepID=D5RP19_9PROT|nr:DNA polymerase III subunit chi [Pseudoroseomonas cervicalis]EFH10950.1 putative DNA polymerase III subunit chi [Pseudoroseomonas cervicalis ATCC 49957]
MSEIGFYHLTRTPLEAALPKLLGRVLSLGGRAVVKLGDAARLASLDASLWLCQDPDWLPHGSAASGQAELQPIWLTLQDEAPNGARYLFLADGAESAQLGDFERVFDLFDGQDEAAVAAARRRWAAAKAAGHVLTYWQQGGRGWEKKFSTAGG